MPNPQQSRWGAALAIGLLALALFLVGPTVAFFGLAPVMIGFQIFGLGGILALTAVVAALVTAVRRGVAVAAPGLLVGGPLAAIFIALAVPGSSVPRINDITTDTDNPPQFVAAGALDHNRGQDLSYPGSTFANQQRAGYPSLAPLALDVSPAAAFVAIRHAARDIPRWRITRIDDDRRELEGVATSLVFRFPDDFIVQVREAEGGGSVVHMRSKSRFGRSDLGANAARIDAFFAAIRAHTPGDLPRS